MIWWILGIIAALIIGYVVAVIRVRSSLSGEIKNPDSQIRKMIDVYLKEGVQQDTEMYAHGAELYHMSSGCPKECGLRIADMFRETHEKSKKKKVEAGL